MISAAAHVLAVNPVPARSQMGSSLGFHIILACFGIAFAAEGSGGPTTGAPSAAAGVGHNLRRAAIEVVTQTRSL